MRLKVSITGEFRRANRLLAAAPLRIHKAAKKATRLEAEFFRRKLIEGLDSQSPGGKAFKPLSPMTLATRSGKGTKALIASGAMRRSISVRNMRDGSFTGILRTKRTSRGESMAELMDRHERGYTSVITVTEAMRNAVFAKLKKFGGGVEGGKGKGMLVPGKTMVIVTPARPLFGPILEAFGKPADVKERYGRRLANILLGDYGRV